MNRITNTLSFVEKATEVHGNLYNYEFVEYTKSTDKVVIVCNSCKNKFEQSPNKHTQGRGCPKCSAANRDNSKIANLKKKPRVTLEVFLKRAREVHGDKYDYSKVVFVTTDTPVIIGCKKCGSESLQAPSNHLRNKGCKHCSSNKVQTLQEFVTKAKSVHGDRYDYSQVSVYSGAGAKVPIVCSVHGVFMQTPSMHCSGHKSGCPSCAKTGFSFNSPGILYYLKINGGQAYKIGITNKTVEHRFAGRDLTVIEVLATTYYEVGQDAFAKEQEILKKYKEYKYTGEPILRTGNSELFVRDVLGLDTRVI